jgi:hypothetical protein
MKIDIIETKSMSVEPRLISPARPFDLARHRAARKIPGLDSFRKRLTVMALFAPVLFLAFSWRSTTVREWFGNSAS